MAKFGEGDPRWLVEDRVDGTNVNNWHWTEYNCITWAKDRLHSLLENIIIKDDAEGYCRTTTIDNINGEVTVSCRKGKIIVFYELDIKIKWEGRFTGKDDSTGKLHIPNLETDEEDFEIKVSSDKESSADKLFCDVIRKQGTNLVRQKVNTFLTELRTEHAQKVLKQVPQKSSPASQTSTSKEQTQPSSSQQTHNNTQEPKKKASKLSSIQIKSKFNASPQELYQAFLDPPRISAFTGSQCSIQPSVGGAFSFFNGNITGEIIELVPNKKIVQKWRFSNWPEGHFSEVVLNFEEVAAGSILYLTQKDVPDDERERTEQGWTEHFIRRMKMMHGWGNMYGE